MQENYSVFKVPSFAKPEAYNFEAFETPEDTNEIYRELNQIAEELEECRLKNS